MVDIRINDYFDKTEVRDLTIMLELKLGSKFPKLISFESTINKWQLFVNQTKAGYNDCIYEYTNDLSTRGLIQYLIDNTTPFLSNKLLKFVSTTDKEFIENSQENKKSIYGRENSQNWWEMRIPKLLLPELEGDLHSEKII
jgi:hypothetical protein